MTKKLIWRLSKLPSVDELQSLVKDKLITQDEAREILFTNEEIEERDSKSLESEIKFLRELIDKLSTRSNVIETIKIIKKPYIQYEWYTPYWSWCTTTNNPTLTYYSGSGTSCGTITSGNTSLTSASTSNTSATGASNFSSIKTF